MMAFTMVSLQLYIVNSVIPNLIFQKLKKAEKVTMALTLVLLDLRRRSKSNYD